MERRVERITSTIGDLQISSSSQFLYRINIKSTSVYSKGNAEKQLDAPLLDTSSHQIGLFIPSQMPPIPQFPIYSKSDELLVTIELLNKDIRLTKEEWDLVLMFHHYTFSELLKVVAFPLIFSPKFAESCMLVVPLKNNQLHEYGWEIDWNILRKVKENVNKSPDKKASKMKKFKFSFSQSSLYQDAVIRPRYTKQKTPQYFLVKRICKELNPTSTFTCQRFGTYERYYDTEFGKKINDLSQPLLECHSIFEHLNDLKRRDENRKGVSLPKKKGKMKDVGQSKAGNYKTYNLPELCDIHPFPPSIWQQAFYLPSIFYRITGLLVADEFRENAAKEINKFMQKKLFTEKISAHHTWPPLRMKRTEEDVQISRTESSFSFDFQPLISDFTGPSPAMVLQSLTTKKSEDIFDMER